MNIEEIIESTPKYYKIKFSLRKGGKKYDVIYQIIPYNKEKRYGKKNVELRDKNGNKLQRAYMTVEGTIIPSSKSFGDNKRVERGFKESYVTEDGNYASRKSLIYVDDDGNELEKYPSSLYRDEGDVAIKLDRKITIDEAMDIDVSHVYLLVQDSGEVNQDLISEEIQSISQNECPKFFAITFAWNETYFPYTAFLQLVGNHLFLIAGHEKRAKFYGKDVKFEEIPVELVEDEKLEFGY